MTREEIIAILADLTANAASKSAAYSSLLAFEEDERRRIVREASQKTFADMMSAMNPGGAPISVGISAPGLPDALPEPSNVTPTPPAQPEACPTRIDLRDTSGWPDSDHIELWELWRYYKEDSIGDAKLYNRKNRDRLVFVRYWNRFLVWAGHHWAEDDYQACYQRVESVVVEYQRLAAEQTRIIEESLSKEEREKARAALQDIHRRIKILRSKNGQDNLLSQVTRIPNPLLIKPELIDKKPYTFPCANGCVDLKTGELHPGKPTDYLYSSCPTEFDPELFASDNPCPVAEAFLLACMNGKQELVDYIWRALGYSMIGEKSKVHAFLIMWGPRIREIIREYLHMSSRPLTPLQSVAGSTSSCSPQASITEQDPWMKRA